jgi:hypothetical protein
MNRIRWLLSKLNYANVTATVALFVALGGASYAAIRVGSGQIVNNSVRSADLRNNDVRGRDVRNRTLSRRDVARNSLDGSVISESRLGTVPDAARLNGRSAFDLRVGCPASIRSQSGVCIETESREPRSFPGANRVCADGNRRLPTYTELEHHKATGGALSAQSEWTSSVYRNPGGPDAASELEVILVTPAGDVAYSQALTPAQRPFRCVAYPSN